PSRVPYMSCICLLTSPPTPSYPLSLHAALPISHRRPRHIRRRALGLCATPELDSAHRDEPRGLGARARRVGRKPARAPPRAPARSEEHTSELQSRENLVCRLLLEKKNQIDVGSK